MEKNKDIAAFAQRLISICEEKNLQMWGRQITLGKMFGVSQNGAKKWLDGESWPRMETMIKIAAWAEVSIDWLITGRGEKRQIVSITPEEQQLLDLYRHADDRGQIDIHMVAQNAARYGADTPPAPETIPAMHDPVPEPVPENIAKNHAFSFGTGGKPYTMLKKPIVIKKKA